MNVLDATTSGFPPFGSEKVLNLSGPNANSGYSFALLDYASVIPKMTRFRIEELENNWITQVRAHFGPYSDLFGGSKTPPIQAATSLASWTEVTQLNIIFNSVWWQTNWLWILVVLIVFGSIGTFVFWRFRVLKRAAQSAHILAENERRARAIGETAFDYFGITDAQHRLAEVSESFQKITGLRPEMAYGKTLWDATCEDTNTQKWHDFAKLRAERRPYRNFRYQIRRPNGEVREILANGKPVFSNDGEFEGYAGTARDITDLVNATRTAERAQVRLHRAIESANASILVFDADKNLEFQHFAPKLKLSDSKGVLRLGMHYADVVKKVMRPNIVSVVGIDDDKINEVLIGRKKDGSEPLEISLVNQSWISLNETETPEGGIVQIWTDITALKHYEDRLRRHEKLKAIGQLTGGVAHDFNNILSVIQGNAELLKLNGEYRSNLVEEIERACHRGSNLAHSLLAYARQQPLQPKPTDLCDSGSALEGILRRTIGENVQLSITCPPGLWRALVDPGKVEDCILNLVFNARDAMPEGGILTIEMSNATMESAPESHLLDEDLNGDFVVISVTDTGTGIPAHILQNITDPFFTTKSVDKGSGLGLSMVYGFVRQSGGNMTVYSELGVGTTVKLYLPRYIGEVEQSDKLGSSAGVPIGNGQTILIVEDDPAVLKTTVRTLETLNYSPVGFASAQSALDYLFAGSTAEMLLSDVVLAGDMSGPDLAEVVRKEFPEISVLFMSGYPAEAANPNGFVGSDSVLMNKPIRREELARTIAQHLS